MELRPYQKQVIQEVYQAWEQGAQNVCVQLPTGAGKTVIVSEILSRHKGYAIAIAHRVELLSQISLTLARYGIRHRFIAQKSSIRDIVSLHTGELGRSFYDPHSRYIVAGVDTLVRMSEKTKGFNQISLVVQDEGHHPLKNNKWGTVASYFPNARGLYPTATPVRADGKGLGRHADGIYDALIVGPPMRHLIDLGYLTNYTITAPPSDVNLKDVPITASGDFSPPKLRHAVHKSRITGDVVENYIKFAAGKSGVTFAVDIEAASEIAEAFRAQGVPAEVITSKTPDLLRAHIMRRFRNKEILQIVNVDLLGEGVDVPAIEVVSMARPTQSFAVYAQQFGRALRPLPGKDVAIIIDHVENYKRHGVPDHIDRTWSLDRRDRRERSTPSDVIPLRNCLNPVCFRVYQRVYKCCPYCGYYPEPAARSAPEFVDGDLCELSPETLAKLRGEIAVIDGAPRVPNHAEKKIQIAIMNRHYDRNKAQRGLRDTIAQWAGYLKAQGHDDSYIHRYFFFKFGLDVFKAQTLSTKEAQTLQNKIEADIATRSSPPLGYALLCEEEHP
jgi:DNA repair protein RadD